MRLAQVRRMALGMIGVLGFGLAPLSQAVGQTVEHLYVPQIVRGYHATGQITGQLLYGGQPEAGAVIELVDYNAQSLQENAVITATTTTTGDFVFDTPPGLAAGDHYYLRYTNPTLSGAPAQFDTTRVLSWSSYDLITYPYDADFAFPTIDVASISMNLNASNVPVPYQFSWGRRAGYTNESYDFVLTDQASAYYSSGLLGYVDHYDLTALPSGFINDSEYVWGVHIVSPTAGEGYSFFYTVMFGLNAPVSLTLSER